jgi:hypothetical protein
MKTAKSLGKRECDTMSHSNTGIVPSGDAAAKEMAREACLEALQAVEQAAQRCLYAGQLLIEWKNGYERGQFMAMVAEFIPEISQRTAQRWMEAARNVAKALPALDINVTISQVLGSPAEELPEEAQKWKQLWFNFTDGKTIKDCISLCVVEGALPKNFSLPKNGSVCPKSFEIVFSHEFMPLRTYVMHC